MCRLYTTQDQSKHLIKLGIDIKTADMFYDGYGCLPADHAYPLIHPNDFKCDTPAWSISALMELFDPVSSGIRQSNGKWYSFDSTYMYASETYDDPFYAVYEMVCWTLGK